MRRLLLLLFLLLSGTSYAAEDLRGFAFQQHQGAALPLDAVFVDSTGQRASLGAFFGARPAILALGYFHCPNLCGTVRSDLLAALSGSGLVAGRDYELAVVSIDPSETPAEAAQAKAQDLARARADGAAQGWHYLTGEGSAVARLEEVVGFRARFDPALRQFLHPAGLVFATPAGMVSGYVLGVGYQAGDVRAAVARAAGGATAAALPVLLLCFHFDPTTGRYTLAVMKLLRLGAALTVLVLGGTLALVHLKGRG
jgi:protein SCO1/2